LLPTPPVQITNACFPFVRILLSGENNISNSYNNCFNTRYLGTPNKQGFTAQNRAQRKLSVTTSTSAIPLVIDNAEDAIFVLLGKEGHLTKIIRQD
jgi:hypothetical protein